MITGVSFNRNAVSGAGGAIYARDAHLELSRVHLEGNTGGGSGGICMLGGSATIRDSYFAKNVASGHGGGAIYAAGGSLLVVWQTNSPQLHL